MSSDAHCTAPHIMRSVLLSLGLALPLASAAVTTLDSTTFPTVVGQEQGVIVKMYAPWCGHCKAMKPDWDKLGDAFGDSTTTIVAEVDCTADSVGTLCTDKGVTGFPTILAFPPGSVEPTPYNGERTYDDLKAFIDGGGLAAPCGSLSRENCAADELVQLEALEALGEPAVKDLIAMHEKALEDGKVAFEAHLKGLQESYEAAAVTRSKLEKEHIAPLKALKLVTFPAADATDDKTADETAPKAEL